MEDRPERFGNCAEAPGIPVARVEFPPGLVWLIGAGPGDPGLMTIQGYDALLQADAVVYDALVNPEFLKWCRKDAELVYAGKRGGRPSPTQDDISKRLIGLAREGRRVARLKGGDPFVFGRGGEEALALVRTGVPIRVTPGVTAGIGGPAYAGIPITHRDTNQTVTFVTGHDQSGGSPGTIDWDGVARGSHTIIMYMALKHLAKIAASLMGSGRRSDEPVAVIFNATLPDQVVIESTLEGVAAEVEEHGPTAPAVICVGRNVHFRKAIDWMAQLKGEQTRSLDPLGQ